MSSFLFTVSVYFCEYNKINMLEHPATWSASDDRCRGGGVHRSARGSINTECVDALKYTTSVYRCVSDENLPVKRSKSGSQGKDERSFNAECFLHTSCSGGSAE